MVDKKDNLLKIIVEEYIKSATPVGSGLVAQKYMSNVSSATVRNYMSELEEEELIYQPHTSAGRIPTVLGYRRYIDYFVKQGKIGSAEATLLDKLAKSLKSDDDSIKLLAKQLADLSDNAVLVGFHSHNVYYTGISNLFKQPEFAEHQLVYSMSEVIDHLDEVMAVVFSHVTDKPGILIGEDNPFGPLSSVVLAKYQMGKNHGLIGILGPNRMDYKTNLGLIGHSLSLLNKL